MDDSTEPALRPPPLTLNRKLPLWYQVAQHLRACIMARRQGDPTRLPIEEDLAAHYGISVMTMRQALRELEDDDLITRHRRRGTFVNESVSSRPLRLLGSVDAVVSQQASDDVLVLGADPVAPPAEFASHFPDTSEVTRSGGYVGRAARSPAMRRISWSPTSPRKSTSRICGTYR